MQAIADTVAASSSRFPDWWRAPARSARWPGDQGNCRSDQSAGAQRRHRGRARRASRGVALRSSPTRCASLPNARARRRVRSAASCRASAADTESAVHGMQAAAPVIASGVTQANSAADPAGHRTAGAGHARENAGAVTGDAEQTRRIEDIVSNVDEVMKRFRTDRECDQAVAALGGRSRAGVERDVLDGAALQDRRAWPAPCNRRATAIGRRSSH
jgi:hypothetical protein